MRHLLKLNLHRNLVVRNSTFSFLDLSFTTLLTLAFTPVLVSRMGIEQFGLWQVCNAILGFLGIFNLGLGDAVIRYVAEYQSKQDLDGIVGVITAVSILNFGLAILLLGPLFALLPWLSRLFPIVSVAPDQVQRSLHIALWGLIPMMVRGVMIAIPKGLQDYRTAALFGTLVNLATSSLAILIVLNGGSVEQMVTGAVIVGWISCVVSILIVARKLMGLAIPMRFALKGKYVRNVLGFSVYVGLTGIGSVIFSVADRVVVGIVLGLSAAGYYAIAIGIASKLPTIGGALTQAFFPAFSAWKQKYDPKEILRRLLYATLAISIPCISLAAFLIIFSRPLLLYWLDETTAMAILPIFRILIFVYVIAPCIAPSFQAAGGLGFPWINTISTWLMSSSTIILIFLLGPLLGLIGAALANGSMLFLLLVPILVVYKIRSMPAPPGNRMQNVEFA